MRAARFQTQKLETAWSSLVTMHSEDIDCSSSASAVGASDEEQGNESNSSSVPLHSGDEQETSPSQYRQAMFKKSEAEREDWEAEEEEEEGGGEEEDDDDQDDDDAEDDDEQEKSVEYGAGSSKDLMFARLSELASQFTKTVDALQRERDGKPSSRSQFSSPPPPARKHPIRFSPPRFAPELVSATQYDDDMERDSLASHSSRTPRKRLIAPWQIISVKLKSSHSKEEAFDAFTQIAVDDLAKAGPCEDVRPSVEDLGGFKRAHVSWFFFWFLMVVMM